MKQVAEHLFSRGKSGKLYCRVRVPKKLRSAYGQTAEILRSLGTSDVAEGRRRLVVELANIYKDFDLKQQRLLAHETKRLQRSAQRLSSLSGKQVEALAQTWVSLNKN
ncbi:MAG: DUF6538 domain-containing protein [Aquabacterium sp.]|jgi:hypothetical protein|uniref:DUF6538 domain-containing protein n=1 Tax=Aquabacterium sp. TaxID=1872578 RepID=UPI003BAE80D9